MIGQARLHRRRSAASLRAVVGLRSFVAAGICSSYRALPQGETPPQAERSFVARRCAWSPLCAIAGHITCSLGRWIIRRGDLASRSPFLPILPTRHVTHSSHHVRPTYRYVAPRAPHFLTYPYAPFYTHPDVFSLGAKAYQYVGYVSRAGVDGRCSLYSPRQDKTIAQTPYIPTQYSAWAIYRLLG